MPLTRCDCPIEQERSRRPKALASSAVPGPGLITAFGAALREPVGRIHWAGTETADVSMGYYDGAIQSGKRVADACIERLKS